MERVGLHSDNEKNTKIFTRNETAFRYCRCNYGKPEIIIMDEPTNALDTQGINLVKVIIKEEKERGAIVIISCHDTSLLEVLSDEIYFIENGKVSDKKCTGGI